MTLLGVTAFASLFRRSTRAGRAPDAALTFTAVRSLSAVLAGGRGTRFRRHGSVLALAALLAWLTCGCGGPVTGVIVGSELNSILSQVETLIQEAGAQGQLLSVQAGEQVQTAIASFQAAYQEDLTKSVDSVDNAVKQQLNSLQQMANALASGVAGTIASAGNQATVLINQLPFTDKYPQVKSVAPPLFAPNSAAPNGQLEVTMTGNFYWASHPGYTPDLMVNGSTYAATAPTTTTLDFWVPESIFPAPTAATIGVKVLTVAIPYQTGVIFHKRRVATYQLPISLLPATPGTVVLHQYTPGPPVYHYTTLESPPGVTSGTPPYHQQGDPNDLTLPYEAPAPAYPWSLDPNGPVNFQLVNCHADPSVSALSGGQVGFSVFTPHHPTVFGIGSGSAIINFWFTYQIVMTTQGPPGDHQTPVPLAWGGSESIGVTPGAWSVDVTPFQGAPQIGIRSNAEVPSGILPFIQVQDNGSYVTISALNPNTLSYTANATKRAAAFAALAQNATEIKTGRPPRLGAHASRSAALALNCS